MNVQPGILCLLIKGTRAGSTTVAVRPVSSEEIAPILAQRFNSPEIKFSDQGPLWEVDIPIQWTQYLSGKTTEIPYTPESHLLPIPPLADPLDITQSRELEHS